MRAANYRLLHALKKLLKAIWYPFLVCGSNDTETRQQKQMTNTYICYTKSPEPPSREWEGHWMALCQDDSPHLIKKRFREEQLTVLFEILIC